MAQYFDFIGSAKIISGRGAIKSLEFFASRFSMETPIIVTDPMLYKFGFAEKVQNALGKAAQGKVFYDVPKDSSLETVEKLYDFYMQNKCYGIIAVGGGSVLDTAKGLRLKLTNNKLPLSELLCIDSCTGSKTPFFALPTTAATGSETTKAAVIFDAEIGRKLEFIDSVLLPDLCILEGSFLDSMPPKSLVTGAFDAITHAVEAYTSTQKNPISDAFAKKALLLIFQNIEKAAEGDLEARSLLLVASNMAGMAFSNAMVGAAHALAHSIGACYRIPHDLSCALILPTVIRYNEPCGYYQELCRQITGQDGNLADVVESLYLKLADKYGIAKCFSQAGIKIENINQLARHASKDGAAMANFKPLNVEGFEKIITTLTEVE